MRWSVRTPMSHRREVFEDDGGAAAMPSIAHLRDVLLLLPKGERARLRESDDHAAWRGRPAG